MLSNKNIYEDLKEVRQYLATEKDPHKKAVVKNQILIIKLLHNLRTNTVAVMKHLKIDLVKEKEE